jgi:hypothetical protein
MPKKPFESTHMRPIRLNLSVWLISHGMVFFSHNKSTNGTFSHGLSAKQTQMFKFVGIKIWTMVNFALFG